MRNLNLDIMKMVFAIVILTSHLHYFDESRFFANYGSLAVDFFFLASGYLCALKVMKNKKEYCPKDTLDFIKGKLAIVLPTLIIAAAVALILNTIVYINSNGYEFWQIAENCFTELNEVLCIEMAGIPAFGVVDVDWYISAMIIGLLILHPIISKYREKFTTVVALVVGLLLLGFIFGRTGTVLVPRTWIIFAYKGLLRGIAEMCLGMFAYTLVQKIKTYDFTKTGKSILSFLEIVCFLLPILFMLTYNKSEMGNSTLEATVIVMLFVGFTVMMSQKSFLNINADTVPRQKISNLLGKLSLLLYLSHLCWILYVKDLFPDFSEDQQLAICAAGIVATIILCYFGSKALEKLWAVIKERSVVAHKEI